jgi:hypothetical protein
VDGRGLLQIWRMAENILNKQSERNGKSSFCSMRVRGLVPHIKGRARDEGGLKWNGEECICF